MYSSRFALTGSTGRASPSSFLFADVFHRYRRIREKLVRRDRIFFFFSRHENRRETISVGTSLSEPCNHVHTWTDVLSLPERRERFGVCNSVVSDPNLGKTLKRVNFQIASEIRSRVYECSNGTRRRISVEQKLLVLGRCTEAALLLVRQKL